MDEDITTFFATNRNLEQTDPPVFGEVFHKDGAEFYRVGKATARRNDAGDYEVTSITVAPEKAGTHGLDTDARLGSRAVLDEMKAAMRDGDRDAIVLIHGYASDFSDAIVRAAELTDKYRIQGKDGETRAPVVLAFSWPANGRTVPFKSYASDRRDAAASGQAMARLFLRLCDFLTAEARRTLDAADEDTRAAHRPCPNRIHLVAHSMGNWALRHGLLAIREARGRDRLPRIFDNIFLMAADEDADALANPEKLGELHKIGNAVHVYHSKDDQALVISDVTKLNPSRLGSNGPEDMAQVSPRVTALDCREVDWTGLLDANHQYYRQRAEVIADVNSVLAGEPLGEIDGRAALPERGRYRIYARERDARDAGRDSMTDR